MAAKMIRIMGESDIVDIDLTSHDGKTSPKLMGLDMMDKINLLGHWMDQDRGEALVADPDYLGAMAVIVAEYVASPDLEGQFATDANFMLVNVLREKWPVGSKAKFQKIAARVGAEHTYLAVPCMAAKVENLQDEAELKQAETSQLAMALPLFRRMRKQFANSSAVQTLIRQGL